jgi:hypothetical protein
VEGGGRDGVRGGEGVGGGAKREVLKRSGRRGEASEVKDYILESDKEIEISDGSILRRRLSRMFPGRDQNLVRQQRYAPRVR